MFGRRINTTRSVTGQTFSLYIDTKVLITRNNHCCRCVERGFDELNLFFIHSGFFVRNMFLFIFYNFYNTKGNFSIGFRKARCNNSAIVFNSIWMYYCNDVWVSLSISEIRSSTHTDVY